MKNSFPSLLLAIMLVGCFNVSSNNYDTPETRIKKMNTLVDSLSKEIQPLSPDKAEDVIIKELENLYSLKEYSQFRHLIIIYYRFLSEKSLDYFDSLKLQLKNDDIKETIKFYTPSIKKRVKILELIKKFEPKNIIEKSIKQTLLRNKCSYVDCFWLEHDMGQENLKRQYLQQKITIKPNLETKPFLFVRYYKDKLLNNTFFQIALSEDGDTNGVFWYVIPDSKISKP